MRYRHVLFNACVLLSSGCSSLIASSGKDITKPTTREEIHAQFGEPIASGMENGLAWEDYHTRTKISDPYVGPGYGMAYNFTFGLIEFIWFPEELGRLTWGAIVGQDVRFTYDDSGRLTFAMIGDTPHRTFARRRAHHGDENPQPQGSEPGSASPKPIVSGAAIITPARSIPPS